jgi:hypothetical protein
MSMAYTTTPVLINVQMADIERVVGSGIASIFSQRDGDNDGDECDLSDEFRSNMDSESEVPDTVQPHSDREVSPAVESLLEKSPDVPMNDSESGGNDSNDHRDRLMTENVNYQGPNAPTESSDTSSNSLESLQQRDKGEEEPLAFIQAVPTPNPVLTPVSISEPDLHSPKDISMDRALNSHEAEIHRFRECLIEAKRNMDRARGQVKEERLEALLGNPNFISLIIESLKYETILKNVFDLLSNASQDIPIVNDHDSWFEPDIPPEIYRTYRMIRDADHKLPGTAHGRLREAHIILDMDQILNAEVQRRKHHYSGTTGGRESRAMRDIKFDMTSVEAGRPRNEMVELEKTDKKSYKTMALRAQTTGQDGKRVSAYTNAMGSSAALMIWPWMKMYRVMRCSLPRQSHLFSEGIAMFIKGSGEFKTIQALIDHLSTWYEGWITGSISSEVVKERLESFLGTCSSGGPLPDKHADARLASSTDTCVEPDEYHQKYIQRFIKAFATIPRGENSTSSTVGTEDCKMSLDVTDMKSLGSQGQLTETAIEAVLTTMGFPDGVMFARASGYGSLYDHQKYEHERSMSINQGVEKILCPIHTGKSNHWVGVVVQVKYESQGGPCVSMELLDSLPRDSTEPIYDEKVIKEIVVTWLRNRLPNFKSFEFDGILNRQKVGLQVDLNSCGVHMLLNLQKASRSSTYEMTGEDCIDRSSVDYARGCFAKQILCSAGENVGGDTKKQIDELLHQSDLDNRG